MTLTTQQLEEDFIISLKNGDAERLREIIAKYPMWMYKDVYGDTPIEFAIIISSFPSVKVLVELGLSQTNEDYRDLAEYYLRKAPDSKKEEAKQIFDFLSQDPASSGNTIQRETEFLESIKAGDVDKVRELLEKYPGWLYRWFEQDEGGRPLTRAIKNIKYDIVKLLMEVFNVDVDDDIRWATASYGFLRGDDLREAKRIEKLLRKEDMLQDNEENVVLPSLEVVKVSYTEMPTAYDMLEMEDIPLFDLITTGEKMVFKFKNNYFSTDLEALKSSLEDNSLTFYECKKELRGSPYTNDVYINSPYSRIQLNGNFTIPEKELKIALNSKSCIFELVPSDKKLEFVASYSSVQVSPGMNGHGRQVDIVSADHCQKGTEQVTYSLKTVAMVKSKTGGKRRKTYRKARKLNRKTRHI